MKRNLIGGTKISNVSKKTVEQKKLIQEIFEETKFVSFNKDKDLTVGEGDEELSYEPLKYPERREVELGVRSPGFVEVRRGIEVGDVGGVGGLERLVEGVTVRATPKERRPQGAREG